MQAEAALFKVLSDQTRLRLAILLAGVEEVCVCELAEALEAPEDRISRHLGVMRSAGMVEVRRQGTWMHYRLCGARNRLESCLQECFRDCLTDETTAREDRQRLAGAKCGPGVGGH